MTKVHYLKLIFYSIVLAIFGCESKVSNQSPSSTADKEIVQQKESEDIQARKENSQQAVPLNSTVFSFEIIENPNSTFGYHIIQNEKVIIRQPHIPAIAGNTGFPKSEQAVEAAKKVIQKLEHGEMPSLSASDIKRILQL